MLNFDPLPGLDFDFMFCVCSSFVLVSSYFFLLSRFSLTVLPLQGCMLVRLVRTFCYLCILWPTVLKHPVEAPLRMRGVGCVIDEYKF